MVDKILIWGFIRDNLHKKFRSILIIWTRDIELWKLPKLKFFLQFWRFSKLYISAVNDQNWTKFFVQIVPGRNSNKYFIHHGQMWPQYWLRVIPKGYESISRGMNLSVLTVLLELTRFTSCIIVNLKMEREETLKASVEKNVPFVKSSACTNSSPFCQREKNNAVGKYGHWTYAR